MDRCSFFIQDKALFGSFPTQESVDTLENNGVRCFIDLTGYNEQLTIPYTTNYRYIKYPILDMRVPNNWKTFARLIIEICDQLRDLKQGEKIYIHCRGGHGRSGIVVACVLCHYYKMSPIKALKITTNCHYRRKEMREKWRRIGSPQNKYQKDFVKNFFRPLNYGPINYSSYTEGMFDCTNYPVEITGLGKFPTASHAFQAYRDPTNSEYINKLQQGLLAPELVTEQQHNWDEQKVKYMYKVLKNKFQQHEHLKNNLMNTGLRPLIKCTKDSYWANGGNGQGKNVHGRILSKLREHLIRENYTL